MRRRGRDPSLDDVVDDVLDAITANVNQMREESQQMADQHSRLGAIAEETKILVDRLREGLHGTE